jgi:hypothetical protein
MKKINFIILVSVVAAVTLIGCKKYADGPTISLESKTARLARTWTIDKVMLNDMDMTAAEIAMDQGGTNVTNTFAKDGGCTVTMTDSAGMMETNTGKWQFANNDKDITISGMMGQASETSTILKLTSDEFWYWHMDGNDKMEMHWKAK